MKLTESYFIEKYPKLFNGSSTFYFYKENDLLNVEQQLNELEKVCNQISTICPNENLLIDFATYKFQNIQISFVDEPTNSIINLLKSKTDAQYLFVTNI